MYFKHKQASGSNAEEESFFKLQTHICMLSSKVKIAKVSLVAHRTYAKYLNVHCHVPLCNSGLGRN